MNINRIELILPGSRNRPITLDISYDPAGIERPVIILVHGFKGFKDWGHFNHMAVWLAEQGFVCLKFNFSHNGTTPDALSDFADLEAFGQNNYSLELADTQRILDFASEHIQLYGGDPNQLCLLGHSRGGGIAILTAATDQRIKKLVTWASVDAFGKFVPEAEIETWKASGVYFTYNSRTQQQMPLYYQLYENFLENRERLNIGAHAQRMNIPWLILHGTGDQTVPVSAAERLHELNPGSRMILLDGSDHNFGGKHPWTAHELPADAFSALAKTIEFLR